MVRRHTGLVIAQQLGRPISSTTFRSAEAFSSAMTKLGWNQAYWEQEDVEAERLFDYTILAPRAGASVQVKCKQIKEELKDKTCRTRQLNVFLTYCRTSSARDIMCRCLARRLGQPSYIWAAGQKQTGFVGAQQACSGHPARYCR